MIGIDTAQARGFSLRRSVHPSVIHLGTPSKLLHSTKEVKCFLFNDSISSCTIWKFLLFHTRQIIVVLIVHPSTVHSIILCI